jgi:Dullard-like phosphatase family protein
MESFTLFNLFNIPMYNKPEVVHKKKSEKNYLSNIPYWIAGQYVEWYQPSPERGNQKTLVLNLEETLVHVSTFPPHPDVQFIEVGSPPFTVLLRPGLEDFLKCVLFNFDVFVFTNGEKDYVDTILDEILPEVDISHRLYRNSCQLKRGNVFKDLDILKRNLKKVILFDDKVATAKIYPNNSVQILSWQGTPEDNNLLNWLVPILERCLTTDNVRDIISNIPKQGQHYRLNSSPN